MRAPTSYSSNMSPPKKAPPAVPPDLSKVEADGIRDAMDEVERGEAIPADLVFDELHAELAALVRVRARRTG